MENTMIKVKYRVRTFTSRFTCYDREETTYLLKPWRVGGVLYGYRDRFNVIALSDDDIISIESARGKA